MLHSRLQYQDNLLTVHLLFHTHPHLQLTSGLVSLCHQVPYLMVGTLLPRGMGTHRRTRTHSLPHNTAPPITNAEIRTRRPMVITLVEEVATETETAVVVVVGVVGLAVAEMVGSIEDAESTVVVLEETHRIGPLIPAGQEGKGVMMGMGVLVVVGNIHHSGCELP